MVLCASCGTEAKEAEARFCYRCGAELPSAKAPSPDDTYWVCYDRFNDRWGTPFGGGNATAEEALAQFNSPAWRSLHSGEQLQFPGQPPAVMRIGHVRNPEGEPNNVHEVLEWLEVKWVDGQWAIAGEASDLPEGRRLVISSLE